LLDETDLCAAFTVQAQAVELAAGQAVTGDAIEAQHPAAIARRRHRQLAFGAMDAAAHAVGLYPRHVQFPSQQRPQRNLALHRAGLRLPGDAPHLALQFHLTQADPSGPPAVAAGPMHLEFLRLAVDRALAQSGVDPQIGRGQVQRVQRQQG